MNKLLFILIVVLLIAIQQVKAQWTKTDSIRLQNILSGKDSLRINPEFQRLLKEGEIINFGPKEQQFQLAPSQSKFPIETDFSDYIKPTYEKKNLQISEKLFDSKGKISDIENHGYDFNDVLSTIFSPSYKQQMKNRRNATAWKHYNDIPPLEVLEERKKYLEEHPEVILSSDTTSKSNVQLADSSSIF